MSSNTRAIVALVGFTVLALSPSFIDWQQSPERHGEIVVYYAVALTLIYVGALRG